MDLPVDRDLERWVAEMVLRGQNWRVSGKKVLHKMHPDDDDGRLRKMLVLRGIWQEVVDGTVSEEILDEIEFLEKLLSSEGCRIMYSMKKAYCAVAAECTAKYMVGVGVERGKYADVLKRIWVERIGSLKERKSELVSEELERWEKDLNDAIQKENVRKKIRNSNTRNRALFLLNEFVAEQWALMGPPFLVTAVNKMKEKRRADRADEYLNQLNKSDGTKVVECVTNVEKSTVVMGTNKQGDNTEGRGDERITVDAEAARPKEQQPLPSRDGDTGKDEHDREKGLGFNEVMVDTGERAQSHDLGVDAFRIVKRQRTDSCRDGDAGIRHSGGAGTCAASEELISGKGALVKGKEICVEGGSPKRKLPASCQHPAGTSKRFDPENLNAQPAASKHNADPCDEVSGVQKVIKTHIMELLELVTNRRPDTLKAVTEEVRAEMAEAINYECQDQPQKSRGAPCQSNENAEAAQDQGTNLGNQHQSHQNDAPKRSLMERNATASTYVWEDSIDDAPEGISPPRQAQRHDRRRRRMWSYEEAVALREGVKRFGTDWKAIKNAYPNELSQRTPVDNLFKIDGGMKLEDSLYRSLVEKVHLSTASVNYNVYISFNLTFGYSDPVNIVSDRHIIRIVIIR